MHAATWLSIWAVDETFDAVDEVVLEADTFEGLLDGIKVRAADEDVHVVGITDGVFIDTSHPSGDGVATSDGVRNAGLLKSRSRSTRSFFDRFHGVDHPLPGEIVKYQCRHVLALESYERSKIVFNATSTSTIRASESSPNRDCNRC